jgi:hypothetical protein
MMPGSAPEDGGETPEAIAREGGGPQTDAGGGSPVREAGPALAAPDGAVDMGAESASTDAAGESSVTDTTVSMEASATALDASVPGSDAPSDSTAAMAAAYGSATGSTVIDASDASGSNPNSACNSGFTMQVTYPVGPKPRTVAIGDVNRDGKPDIVVTNAGDGTVGVLLGGVSGFAPQQTYAAGTAPSSLALADVTADGVLDAIVGNLGARTVSVLVGRGDGTFDSPMGFGLPSSAGPVGSIAVADVNRDQKPDLVVANDGADDVSVLLGRGDGTFGIQNEYGSMIVGASSLGVVDFNRDGILDVAVTSLDTIAVLHGVGDGSFIGQTSFLTAMGPAALAIGDLDRNGNQDLVVADAQNYELSVLLGDGHGKFATQVVYPISAAPNSVVLADLNADGALDAIVGTDTYEDMTPSNSIYVLLGNGDGTLRAPTTFDAGKDPSSIAVGDPQPDGSRVLAVANSGSNDVTVIALQPCGGTAGTPRPSRCVAGASCVGPLTLICAGGQGAPRCIQTCDCSQSGVYCGLGCP